jgi:hypothetical protein
MTHIFIRAPALLKNNCRRALDFTRLSGCFRRRSDCATFSLPCTPCLIIVPFLRCLCALQSELQPPHTRLCLGVKPVQLVHLQDEQQKYFRMKNKSMALF